MDLKKRRRAPGGKKDTRVFICKWYNGSESQSAQQKKQPGFGGVDNRGNVPTDFSVVVGPERCKASFPTLGFT